MAVRVWNNNIKYQWKQSSLWRDARWSQADRLVTNYRGLLIHSLLWFIFFNTHQVLRREASPQYLNVPIFSTANLFFGNFRVLMFLHPHPGYYSLLCCFIQAFAKITNHCCAKKHPLKVRNCCGIKLIKEPFLFQIACYEINCGINSKIYVVPAFWLQHHNDVFSVDPIKATEVI